MRDHNAEYVIRVTELASDRLVGLELRDDGTEYPADLAVDHLDWQIRDPHAQIEVSRKDIQVGDTVTVYVETWGYTAVGVEHFTLHPRRLHERLLRVEQHLGLS